MGGKYRIRKQISAFLESIRKENQVYFEPFVGGAWVLQEMSGSRIASDANYPLITMYKALKNGWTPPTEVSEELYQSYKKNKLRDDPMTAFLGFGCSFAGKWFGGFARPNKCNKSYALNTKNSLIQQCKKLENTTFNYGSFNDHNPKNFLIYCDPPYFGTTQYNGCEKFDHITFWEAMRQWSKENTVVISEYQAPEDFKIVMSIDTKTNMRMSTGFQEKRVERLFMLSNFINFNY